MSDAIAATNLLKSTNRTVDLCVFVCVCTSRIILFSLVGNISIFSVTNPLHCGLPPFLPHPRGINTVLVPVLPVTEGFTPPKQSSCNSLIPSPQYFTILILVRSGIYTGGGIEGSVDARILASPQVGPHLTYTKIQKGHS